MQTRIEGRSGRIAIARHGETEFAEARRPANEIRNEKETLTLREFFHEYLCRSEPHWKLSGRKTACIYLNDRIGPEDVAAWFDTASKDRPGAANRAFEILRALMFRTEEWRLRERGSNPCLGIVKNPRNRIARFRDTDELARLGCALDGPRPPPLSGC